MIQMNDVLEWLVPDDRDYVNFTIVRVSKHSGTYYRVDRDGSVVDAFFTEKEAQDFISAIERLGVEEYDKLQEGIQKVIVKKKVKKILNNPKVPSDN